jgi:hypothetical protein
VDGALIQTSYRRGGAIFGDALGDVARFKLTMAVDVNDADRDISDVLKVIRIDVFHPG